VESHPDWALGYCDQSWWSRLARPLLHSWTDEPLRLIEQTVAKDDPDPKALACYGLLLRSFPAGQERCEELWLRFCDGNPKSAYTIAFLDWCCRELTARGTRVWVLLWDHASWHKSEMVRSWIRAHNHQVKREQQGVRILVCLLPKKSPWLSPIEPMWVHSKRAVAEADRLLAAAELEDRVYAYFGCPHDDHLIAKTAA
jgi:hypothetical protein